MDALAPAHASGDQDTVSGGFWLEEQEHDEDDAHPPPPPPPRDVRAQERHLVRQIRHLRKRVGLSVVGRVPSEL